MRTSSSAQFLANAIRSRLGRRFFALPFYLRRRWFALRDAPSNRILDHLTATIDGDVTMNVVQFGGTFVMDPRSHLFRRVVQDTVYEPELWSLFLRYTDPDRDVIDVGANVGFFSVGAACHLRKGRVLAAEPMPDVFSRLSRNIENNGVAGRTILYNGAISDRAGQMEIHSIPGLEEYSSLGTIRHPAARGKEAISVSVPTARLDDLVSAHDFAPGIIKIDVEGAEAFVLAGAQAVLREFSPVIISELSDALLKPMGTSAREIVQKLRDLGYLVVDPVNPSVEPGNAEFGDILCLPRDRRYYGG